MSSPAAMDKPGDRSSKATISLSSPLPELASQAIQSVATAFSLKPKTSGKAARGSTQSSANDAIGSASSSAGVTRTLTSESEFDNDAESQFSYVQSMTNADLSYNPQPVSKPQQQAVAEHQEKPTTPVSRKLFNEIRSSLDSLNINNSSRSSSGGAFFSHGHEKRESYTSTFSQYSGQIESSGAEPVSVVSINQDMLDDDFEAAPTGLKRGVSVTKVSTPHKPPRVPRAPSSATSHAETVRAPTSTDHTPKFADASSFPPTGPDMLRTPSQTHSLPVGPLETVSANPTATPTSLYSDASEGKDFTMVSAGPSKKAIKPTVTSNTHIESTIPPRSSRRPKSEFFDDLGSSDSSLAALDNTIETASNATSTNSTQKKKRHSKKRSSLSVTDGLDELMRNVNRMQTPEPQDNLPLSTAPKKPDQPKPLSKARPPLHSASSSVVLDSTGSLAPRNLISEVGSIDSSARTTAMTEAPSSDEVLRSEVSHDMYMTAEEDSGHSAENVGVGLGIAPNFVPPQHTAALSSSSGGITVSKKDSLLPPRPSADNIKRAREVSRQISLKEEELKQLGSDETDLDRNDTLVVHKNEAADTTATFTESRATPKIKVDTAVAGGTIGAAAVSGGKDSRTALPSGLGLVEKNQEASLVPESLQGTEVLTEPLHLQSPPLLGDHPAFAGPGAMFTPAAVITPVNPTRQAPHLLQHQKIPSSGLGVLDDDDFYDIEPIAKPARAKSVKQATTTQRSKPKLKRKSASGALKPFSYQTLISLLESTNGTVIGEEFSQLDLPAKEKQLIEKIIDALSRLSADMVLDRDRYEVGISRLENALRVLEGFM